MSGETLHDRPWHPATCGPHCAVYHCQNRCGRLAAHGRRRCTECDLAPTAAETTEEPADER